jgi:hypothetical protein
MRTRTKIHYDMNHDWYTQVSTTPLFDTHAHHAFVTLTREYYQRPYDIHVDTYMYQFTPRKTCNGHDGMSRLVNYDRSRGAG